MSADNFLLVVDNLLNILLDNNLSINQNYFKEYLNLNINKPVGDDAFDDSSDFEDLLPILSISQLNELYDELKLIDRATSQITSNLLVIKLAACVFSSIMKSKDYTVTVYSCILMIELCSLPGAKSYGILINNVIYSIISSLNKAVNHEIKCKDTIHEKKSNKLSKATASSKRSNKNKVSGNDEVDRDEYDSLQMTYDIFENLLNCLNESYMIFCDSNNSDSIDFIYGLLINSICLCNVKSDYSDLLKSINQIYTKIATFDSKSFILALRSLQPLLTLTGKDSNNLPDGMKLKSSIHQSIKPILLSIYNSSKQIDFTSSIINTSNDDDMTISPDRDESMISSTSFNHAITLSTYMIGLLQRMTLYTADKTNIRNIVKISIIDFLVDLSKQTNDRTSTDIIINYICFLNKLLRSNKSTYRYISIELITDIFISSSFDTILYTNSYLSNDFINELVINVVKRCNDIIATVRLKALVYVYTICEQIQSSKSFNYLSDLMLKLLFGYKYKHEVINKNSRLSITSNDTKNSGSNNYINFLDILKLRCCDNKSVIKAKAIQTFGLVLSISWLRRSNHSCDSNDFEKVHLLLTDEEINIFTIGCNDVTSITIRKSSMNGLTSLLSNNINNQMIISAWIVHVLPIISNSDNTILKRLLDIIYYLFIIPITNYMNSNAISNQEDLLWQLCQLIDEFNNTKYLRQSFQLLYKNGLIYIYAKSNNNKSNNSNVSLNDLIDQIILITKSTNELVSKSGWILLSVIASLSEFIDVFSHGSVDYIVSSFIDSYTSLQSLNSHMYHMLVILEKLSDKLSNNRKAEMKLNLDKIILQYDQNTLILSTTISLRYNLIDQSYHELVEWFDPLLNQINKILSHSIESSNISNSQIEIIWALHILGELSLIGFKHDEDEYSFIDNKLYNNNYLISNNSIKIIISNQLIQLVQFFMSDTLVKDQESIRGYAFITMGKICLRNSKLVHKQLNIFIRELNQSNVTNNVVKCNCLIILSDFTIRYTNLIDRYINNISTLLYNEDLTIRRMTLVILTQLILQDYIKFKGCLFYRFLTIVIDSNIDFQESSKNILRNTLFNKYPEYNMKLIECIVVYNECRIHPMYNSVAFDIEDDDQSVASSFNLSGANNHLRRVELYEFLLIDIKEELKIQVIIYQVTSNDCLSSIPLQMTAKLVQDILSFVIDSSSYCNDDNMQNVLIDTFALLQSNILKIDSKKKSDSSNEFDEDIDNNTELDKENTTTAVNKAKTKVLKVLSKQHLLSHVLPVVMSLKHVLESKRSPIQGKLMDYLIYLMKEYKQEVEEILQTDPILKAELQYDMKNYEKQKTKANFEDEDNRRQSKAIHKTIDSSIKAVNQIHSPIPSIAQIKDSMRKSHIPTLRKTLDKQQSIYRTPKEALLTATKGSHINNIDFAERLLGSNKRIDEDNEINEYYTLSDDENIETTNLFPDRLSKRWSITINNLDEVDENVPNDSVDKRNKRKNEKMKNVPLIPVLDNALVSPDKKKSHIEIENV